MVFKLALATALLTCTFSICASANILYIIPFKSKSHNIMLRPIGLELARRGHNVTVITAYKEKNPPTTYQEVIVDNKIIWDVLGIERPNVFDMVQVPTEDFLHLILFGGGLGITEVTLNTTDVQKFLANDNSFDLVISEQFFQESLNILAYKYKAPLVLVTTFGNCMRHNIVTRNPLQLATTLHEFLELKDPTSFWGRLRNFYFSMYEYVYWRYWYLEKQEALVKKYIQNLVEPVPSLYEMQKNAAMILVNGHFGFESPIAYLPNVVEIGGAHLSKSDAELPDDLRKIFDEAVHGVVYVNLGSNVQSSELPAEKRDAFLNVFRKLKQKVLWKWENDNLPNKPDNLIVRKWMPQKEILCGFVISSSLYKLYYISRLVIVGMIKHIHYVKWFSIMDLRKIFDEAVHGVVYVNLGSNVQSSELPAEKRDAFLNVFRKLKQKVLWKWENDNLPNKPDNLIVRKWMPQKEILSHPNIKVFIAHGGLIGTQEAIFHGVPIIGVPIYADQYNNLLQAENLGFGRILQYNDINEQSLQNHLDAVLRNDLFKRKALEVSRRFKDRPMSALDTAMFWIEYVIRHKGAEHMKNPALNLSWVAYTMLDVYAFILAGCLLFVYIIYRMIGVLRYSKKHSKTSKVNKKKQH